MDWANYSSPSRLDSFVDDLVDVWHLHRTPILLTLCVILVAIRTYFYINGQKTEIVAFKKVYEEPAKPKVVVEEKTPTIEPVEEKKNVKSQGPRRIKGGIARKPSKKNKEEEKDLTRPVAPLVFFSSITTKTAKIAEAYIEDFCGKLDELSKLSGHQFLKPELRDLTEIDFDDYFLAPYKGHGDADLFYLFLIPSYNIDTINDTFLEHLQETHHDFRIDTAPLSGILGYSVFGFGDSENWPTEADGFCFQAMEVDKWMAKLTARKRAYPVGMGDMKSDHEERLQEWSKGVQEDEDDGEVVFDDEEPKKKSKSARDLDDVEDLGRLIKKDDGSTTQKAPLAVDFTTYGSSTKKGSPSGPQKKWSQRNHQHTKLSPNKVMQLGISFRSQDMPPLVHGTTPSLSCSNKCVFCWRHGTNPVGTTWRWVVDPPELIFEGVKKNHYQKIKMLRGVPGVRAERFAEAMQIKHCALSLVGEPIFYPYINEFLGMLHAERISSFLVCNAQHPDQLAALKVVTQLYVSIDAADKERFNRCLDILREKRFHHRTVFRLTLVKGFNVEEEAEGYARLVEQGLPCFVEVKGVTYCGTSTSSNAGLSMSNVPFYWEVCDFVKALEKRLKEKGLKYGIAAEHAHSCCILLASERFYVDGKWHTLIDYKKFFELLESRGPPDEGGWTPEDYMDATPTPEWANWGNGGFNPEDERVDRKGRKIEA
ncbi:hypothetical protein DER44DRAFT_865048 [Fusarium oxysporum]|nr:hypothetical protein DER44DRAFT_865048 [Fusarium oxysporum]